MDVSPAGNGRVSMFQYLWDTFDYLIPICGFIVVYIFVLVTITSIVKRRLEVSPAAPALSAFMLAYVSALGGKYSIWPSAVLLGAGLAFQRFTAIGHVEIRSLFQSYRWQAITFCAAYIVCTNYFLRAFQP
jgi:hypothetical protein